MRIAKERIITAVMTSILAAVFLAVPVCAEESEDIADVDGVIISEKAMDVPAAADEDSAADTDDLYQENEFTPDASTEYSGTVKASELGTGTIYLSGDTTLNLDTNKSVYKIDCNGHALTITGDKTLKLSPDSNGKYAIYNASVFTLESGTVEVLGTYADSYGIRSSHSGTNKVIINGGSFITRKSEYGIDVSGDVIINGGTVDLTISALGKGIECRSTLKITGGTVSIQPYDTTSYLSEGLSVCGQESGQTYGGIVISGGNINSQGQVRSDVNGIYIGGNTNMTINSGYEGREAILIFPRNDEETITVAGAITKPAGGKVKKVLSEDAYIYTITAGERGAEEVVINCQQKPSLVDAEITGIEDGTYTGAAVEQNAVVSLGGKVLQEGRDYIVSYKDNVNAGTATVTFTGKGDYEGTVSRQFTINKADRTITASDAVKKYGDGPFDLGAKLSGEGKLSYKSENTFVVTVDDSGKATIKGAGSAKIVISSEATANYNAVSKKITVTVNKADRTITASDAVKKYGDGPFDLGAKLSGEGKLSYRSENTSVVTVDDSGKATIKGAGSAKIVISSEATPNYNAVSKKITVTVNPADISKASVEKIKNTTYTGKAVKPAPTVTLNGETLKADVDYTTVYANNKNAGTAKITVTGKGNYKGSLTVTFKIKKASISIKTKKITVGASVIKKKDKSYSAQKAFVITKNTGKVTYKKTKGTNKISVSKTGKITLKKGLKKGSYTVKVKVAAKGDKNHTKATKTVSLKVVVK